MGRLEVIADTFLVDERAGAVGAAGWLAGRQGIQGQILARVKENLAVMAEARVAVQRAAGGGGMECDFAAAAAVEWAGCGGEAGAGGWGGGAPGVVLWDGRGARVVVSLIGSVENFRSGLNAMAEWCESRS